MALLFDNPYRATRRVILKLNDHEVASKSVDIPANGRVQLPASAVEIDANGDVIVEHYLSRSGAPGQSGAASIPLR